MSIPLSTKSEVPVAGVSQDQVPTPVFWAIALNAQPVPVEPTPIMYLSPVVEAAILVVEIVKTGDL